MLLPIQNDADREFMARTYLDYRRLMFSVAMEIVKDPLVAEDIVSAAVLKMMGRIEMLRRMNRCRLRAYIAVMVRNDSIDSLRKRKHCFLPKDEAFMDDIAAEGTLEEEILRRADAAMLYEGMARLSQRERWLLTKKYLNDVPNQELARLLGIGNGSVRSYLSRARRHLKQIIVAEGSGAGQHREKPGSIGCQHNTI